MNVLGRTKHCCNSCQRRLNYVDINRVALAGLDVSGDCDTVRRTYRAGLDLTDLVPIRSRSVVISRKSPFPWTLSLFLISFFSFSTVQNQSFLFFLFDSFIRYFLPQRHQ